MSDKSEKLDKTEKRKFIENEEIPEYWIIDIKNQAIETYDLDYENKKPRIYFIDIIIKDKKEAFDLIRFPHIKINSEQLFDGVDG